MFGSLKRLDPSALCDVDLGCKDVVDRSIIRPERAGVQLVPEWRAIFPIVEYLHCRLALLQDRRAYGCDGDRRRALALQKAAVPTDNFVGRVARQLEKCSVCKHNRSVRRASVRHDHRHSSPFESKRGQFLSVGKSLAGRCGGIISVKVGCWRILFGHEFSSQFVPVNAASGNLFNGFTKTDCGLRP